MPCCTPKQMNGNSKCLWMVISVQARYSRGVLGQEVNSSEQLLFGEVFRRCQELPNLLKSSVFCGYQHTGLLKAPCFFQVCQIFFHHMLHGFFLNKRMCLSHPFNITLQGINISPKNGIFEDDFPFPKVGYVNSLEGNLLINSLPALRKNLLPEFRQSSLNVFDASRFKRTAVVMLGTPQLENLRVAKLQTFLGGKLGAGGKGGYLEMKSGSLNE